MAAYTGVNLLRRASHLPLISKAGIQLISPFCTHIRTCKVVYQPSVGRATFAARLMPKNKVVFSSISRTHSSCSMTMYCFRGCFQLQVKVKHNLLRAQTVNNLPIAICSISSASTYNRGIFLGSKAYRPILSGHCKRMCSVSGTCWNCSAPWSAHDNGSAVFFCDKCNMIQPVIDDLTHFQIMQCEERYDIDVGQLTQTFRSLQRRLHPDKFSNKSQKEQAYSADQSSAVNKAYRTLLKPLSRGLYLLQLHGRSIEEGDSVVEPEFLMEVMETNEQLAETQDMDTVRQIRAKNSEKLNELIQKLTQTFSSKNYVEARNILVHLKYYANIEDKAKDILGTDA